jgi:hypothetical protein
MAMQHKRHYSGRNCNQRMPKDGEATGNGHWRGTHGLANWRDAPMWKNKKARASASGCAQS